MDTVNRTLRVFSKKNNDSLHVEVLILKVEESPIIKKGRLRSSVKTRPKLKQQQIQESLRAGEITIMILVKLTAAKLMLEARS